MTDIIPDPPVEQTAQEFAPLRRSHAMRRQRAFLAYRSKASVGSTSFHDGSELNIPRPDPLEKIIELFRIFNIIVIDNSHCVPFNAIALQHTDPTHHRKKRRLPTCRSPILIVEILRPVNRDADKPTVIA